MKESYRELCRSGVDIPLFSQDWWLDAIVGESGWDVVIVESAGLIIGTMPFVTSNRIGHKVSVQPPLTQTLGPWLRREGIKPCNWISHEKEVLQSLATKLPRFSHVSHNWHHSQTNWLPFYWAGFKQTTRYTYRIETIENEIAMWSDVQKNIRSDIKKARERYRLQLYDDRGLEEFRSLLDKTFARQGLTTPYSLSLMQRIDEACAQRNCRRIIVACDDQGRAHAGAYLVWDADSTYYLMGGGDPALRTSGATSLVLWESIREAVKHSRSFDFEGSMLEPVERFFRAFGARQTPYFQVSRSDSISWRILEFLQSLRRAK